MNMEDGRFVRAVLAGNTLQHRAEQFESNKIQATKSEIEQKLTELVAEFIEAANLLVKVRIEFCDVHALMKRTWHVEMAYVRLDGHCCDLLFHNELLVHKKGCFFVAKCWVLLVVVSEMLRHASPLSTEFVFEIGDTGYLDQVAFNSNNPGACIILDHHFASANGYSDYRLFCDRELISWDKRIAKVFWRGSTTGLRLYDPPPPNAHDDLGWLPRLSLCRAANSPSIGDFCDVGISGIVQMPEPHLTERVKSAGFLKDGVSRRTFTKYRGAFDIDGNANAWSGFFCSLLGGSCVIKIASIKGFRQWYYSDLKSWLHYIPVRSDLSDLEEGVNWFAQHDVHAREIAARGRELALKIDMEHAVMRSAVSLSSWLERK